MKNLFFVKITNGFFPETANMSERIAAAYAIKAASKPAAAFESVN